MHFTLSSSGGRRLGTRVSLCCTPPGSEGRCSVFSGSWRLWASLGHGHGAPSPPSSSKSLSSVLRSPPTLSYRTALTETQGVTSIFSNTPAKTLFLSKVSIQAPGTGQVESSVHRTGRGPPGGGWSLLPDGLGGPGSEVLGLCRAACLSTLALVPAPLPGLCEPGSLALAHPSSMMSLPRSS